MLSQSKGASSFFFLNSLSYPLIVNNIARSPTTPNDENPIIASTMNPTTIATLTLKSQCRHPITEPP